MTSTFDLLIDQLTDAGTLEEVQRLAYISFDFLEKEEFYEFTKHCHRRYDEIHKGHFDIVTNIKM